MDQPTLTREAIQLALDSKTKPPGSLGRMEDLAAQLAMIQGTLRPFVDQQRVVIFAGSHGIAAEGVSAYPASVTAQMVRNFTSGGAAICVMCRSLGVDLRIVDVGVDDSECDLRAETPTFRRAPVRKSGTSSFLNQPAMTAAECQQAMQVGADEVRRAVADGMQILGIGEMGIGNTTAASALSAAISGLSAEVMVGLGTGVNAATLAHKIQVVQAALSHHAEVTDALARLACYGGFEIAAMTGAILEAYRQRFPIVIDGFISTAAAVAAHALEPAVLGVCFFSHCSAEKGHSALLRQLQAEPILDLDLRLGEATGSALAMPLLKAAASILRDMATFSSAGVSEKRSA
jgi:nicotinate-nucleotide--dimethylbenzimidazole phosphoribosyltransferase